MTLKKHRIIGLTGQTGAGKSTVSKVLLQKGAAVINADELVTELYTPDSVCLKTLAAQNGSDILRADKSLDRPKLAQRAFADKESSELLGKIVHPFVLTLFLEKTAQLVQEGYRCIVFDAPQLFESKANVFCDYIVSVIADRAVRLERICKRDNISAEVAESRMNVQFPQEFFMQNSDFVIENNGSEEQLREKAGNLISALV